MSSNLGVVSLCLFEFESNVGGRSSEDSPLLLCNNFRGSVHEFYKFYSGTKSLIMQQQSLPNELVISSLEVNIGPLNSTLNEIARSIRHHASVFNKVKGLESDHHQIKKELHSLRLDLAAKESNNGDSGSKAARNQARPSREYHSIKNMGGVIDDSNTIGLDRLDSANSTERRGVLSSPSEHQGDVYALGSTTKESRWPYPRNDVSELKGIVRQLQEELNNEIAQHLDMESRIESNSRTLVYLESEHDNGSIYSALQDQRQFVKIKLDSLNQTISEVATSIRSEVDIKQNSKLQEIKKWCNDLDQNRQSKFNIKMASFAKSSEVLSLQDCFDSKSRDHFHRISHLAKAVIGNEHVMFSFQQKSSMRSFAKIHRLWKVKAMQMTWTKWQNYNNEIERIAQRRKTMRKIMIRTWFGNKARAWKKWQDFIERQQGAETKRLLAIKLIRDKAELAVIQPTRISFNTWRRNTVALKIQDANMKSKSVYNHKALSEPSGQFSESFISTDRQSNEYNLSLVLESFNDDKDGAIQTLAQEINNIRMFDIKTVYKDMALHIEQLKTMMKATSSMELLRLGSEMREIESKSNMAFQEISSQLPEIQSNTAELRNSLRGTINRVKVIEHTHQDRLENLFEGKEAMKEEILTLQTKLNNSYKIIHSLQYDSTRYQNTTNTLLQKMNKVESLLASHEQSTHRETNDIRAQLGNINDKLRYSDAQSCKLSSSLTETRNEVIQAKVASSLGLKEISDILNSHGIHQPQWNIVIEYGGIYERNAKENNYVSPINVISDGGEAIDIPSTLASFAHDYAAWTAFTADHDALKLVIIGKNPDTVNALEVDIEERRTIVVER